MKGSRQKLTLAATRENPSHTLVPLEISVTNSPSRSLGASKRSILPAGVTKCPSTAQKMVGHSDIRMTLATYTHASYGMQDSTTAALEQTTFRSGC
jgi:hypothetical protein